MYLFANSMDAGTASRPWLMTAIVRPVFIILPSHFAPLRRSSPALDLLSKSSGAHLPWRAVPGSVAFAQGDITFIRLYQPQFFRASHSRPAAVDVEFAVDALGMSADRAQANHELTGDLRPGQLCPEQSQDFQLTLTEGLD